MASHVTSRSLMPTRLLLLIALCPTFGLAEDWQTVFTDSFDSGQLDRAKWQVWPPEAAPPAFDARDGGFAVHPRTETSNRCLVTLARPMPPYRLAFDFNQPANEAGGYRLVVHHPAQGGETWWFEFGAGDYAVWTTYQGTWAARWQGPALKTDTWYRLLVEEEPLRVRMTLRDMGGQVAAQSDWIPHDSLGEPQGISFEAASGGGLRGCLFDNVALQAPTTAAVRRQTFGVDESLHAALGASRLNTSTARVAFKADGLSLALDADGVARQVTVEGTSLFDTPQPGGFYAVDIARGPQARQFRAIVSTAAPELRCPELQLRLRPAIQSTGSRIDFTCTVQDESGQDRALLIYYVLPMEARGWEWGDSLTASRPIAEEGRYDSSLIYGLSGASGRHLLAPFPWGTLAGQKRGLMVMRPLDWPRLMTWMYDFTSRRRCLVIRTELGLSPLTRKFPSRADFRFSLSRLPQPEWGMRAAAQRYYALYPDFFVRRVKVEGLWHLWVTPKVPQPEDFALVFHEQEPYSEDRIVFDDQHSGLSFTYSEPNALWQRCTSYEKGAFQAEQYLEVLRQRAAQPPEVTTDYPFSTQPKRLPDALEAQAALNSYLGSEGQLAAVWPAPPDRVCLGMNSDPELPQPNRATLWLDYEGQPALNDPRVDGAYLDSLGFGGFDQSEDFRKEHWAIADLPLIPSFRAGAPAQLGQFTHQELFALVARLMRERGKYVLANTFPSNHLFTAHLLDVMGAGEGADLEAFHTVRQLGFCRALAYHKPLSHMNYAYFDPKVPIEQKERAMQRNLLYGVWPGSGNVPEPQQIEPLRPLYKRYMPLFRALGQAGWEPIPCATVAPEPLVVERYGPTSGPLFLVVHNPSETPAEGRLALVGELAGRPWQRQLIDAVSGRRYRLAANAVRIELRPWQTVMLRLEPGSKQ